MREESNGQWLTRVTPLKNKIAALAFECLKMNLHGPMRLLVT
jgi:hypothetical protein